MFGIVYYVIIVSVKGQNFVSSYVSSKDLGGVLC